MAPMDDQRWQTPRDASITLDFSRYLDDDGRLPADVIFELTDGLDVSVGEVKSAQSDAGPFIKFISNAQELRTLIDRYEEDQARAATLYGEIIKSYK